MQLRTLIFPLLLVGCTEAFSAHPQVVARMEDQELPVRRLAELMVLAQPLPLTEEVGRELARYWVDVAAFAHRLASGDSLWDSSFVREAMWLNLQQLSIARFRDSLARETLLVTPTTVDSAYRVGEERIVAHVLKSVPTGSSIEQRREQRAAAEAIREGLRNGGGWDTANALSDDSIAIATNGNLGILRRGVALPRFENAAYALDPGSISPVVETQFGYHIIFRPRLEDVRGQFTQFVEQELRARFDSTYDATLTTALNIRANRQTPIRLRDIATAPFGNHNANDAVVTYDGGKVTSARFAKYLRMLSPETHRDMTVGGAQPLSEFAVGVALQEIMVAKVDSAGMHTSDSVVAAVIDSYHRELVSLWTRLGILPDSVLAAGENPSENASRLVNGYLDAAVSRQKQMTPLPPFLAAHILEGVQWEIDPRALAASVQMALRLQAGATSIGSVDNP